MMQGAPSFWVMGVSNAMMTRDPTAMSPFVLNPVSSSGSGEVDTMSLLQGRNGVSLFTLALKTAPLTLCRTSYTLAVGRCVDVSSTVGLGPTIVCGPVHFDVHLEGSGDVLCCLVSVWSDSCSSRESVELVLTFCFDAGCQ